MADKVEKPKKSKAKPKKDEKGVLAALPSTRPERIGTRRASVPQSADAPAGRAKGSPASAGAKPVANATTTAKDQPAKPAAAKTAPAKPAAAKRSTPKAPATKAARPAKQGAAPRATAARRKAAAPRTFEPTPAAESAAGTADERAAAPPPREPEPRPRAVREGAPGMGTTGEREPQQSSEHGRPSGVELVTTAVQAAGELAQVGLSIGGRIFKRAVDRLPKP